MYDAVKDQCYSECFFKIADFGANIFLGTTCTTSLQMQIYITLYCVTRIEIKKCSDTDI